jgi:hypothetical protein
VHKNPPLASFLRPMHAVHGPHTLRLYDKIWKLWLLLRIFKVIISNPRGRLFWNYSRFSVSPYRKMMPRIKPWPLPFTSLSIVISLCGTDSVLQKFEYKINAILPSAHSFPDSSKNLSVEEKWEIPNITQNSTANILAGKLRERRQLRRRKRIGG